MWVQAGLGVEAPQTRRQRPLKATRVQHRRTEEHVIVCFIQEVASEQNMLQKVEWVFFFQLVSFVLF